MYCPQVCHKIHGAGVINIYSNLIFHNMTEQFSTLMLLIGQQKELASRKSPATAILKSRLLRNLA